MPPPSARRAPQARMSNQRDVRERRAGQFDQRSVNLHAAVSQSAWAPPSGDVTKDARALRARQCADHPRPPGRPAHVSIVRAAARSATVSVTAAAGVPPVARPPAPIANRHARNPEALICAPRIVAHFDSAPRLISARNGGRAAPNTERVPIQVAAPDRVDRVGRRGPRGSVVVPRGYPSRPGRAWSVPCPTCRVPAGVGCVVTRGKHAGERLHGTHPARVRVASARARQS
jgi:hypothetical protein